MTADFAHIQVYGALTVSSDLNVTCDKVTLDYYVFTIDND